MNEKRVGFSRVEQQYRSLVKQKNDWEYMTLLAEKVTLAATGIYTWNAIEGSRPFVLVAGYLVSPVTTNRTLGCLLPVHAVVSLLQSGNIFFFLFGMVAGSFFLGCQHVFAPIIYPGLLDRPMEIVADKLARNIVG